MSQRHIKKSKQPPRPIVWGQVALVSAIFVVSVAALFTLVTWIHSIPSTHQTAAGKILAIRKVVDDTRETLYGGKIYYRFEARVRYVASGETQDRWLRVSDDLPSESLAVKLAAQPTECLVYWPPDHPENAKCSLK